MKSSNHFCFAIVAGLTFTFGYDAPLRAAGPAPEDGASSVYDEAAPFWEGSAVIDMGLRKIAIYPAGNKKQRSASHKNLYFVSPILALKKRPADSAECRGCPSIFWNKKERDGLVWLYLVFTGVTENLLKAAIQQIQNDDKEWLDTERISANQIRVEPLDVTGIGVAFKNQTKPSAILPRFAGDISRDHTTYRIAVPIDPAKVDGFFADIENDPEDISLEVYLKYTGSIQDFASMRTTVTQHLQVELEEFIKANIAEGKPVFQKEKQKYETALNTMIQVDFVGSKMELMTAADSGKLVSQISEKFFTPTEWMKIDSLSNEHRKALAEYVRPLLNTLNTGTEDFRTKERTKTETSGGKVGIEYAGAGVELNKENVDQARETWGVKVVKNEQTQKFEPTEVRVSFLTKDWRKGLASSDVNVALLEKEVNAYNRELGIIPIDFTADKVEQYITARRPLVHGDYVPRGAMLCYFGAGREAPAGYVFADGATKWPEDAAWLPERLRGHSLPDMSGYLVGGTDDEAEVGLMWQQGVLEIPTLLPQKETGTTELTRPSLELVGPVPDRNRAINESQHPVLCGFQGSTNNLECVNAMYPLLSEKTAVKAGQGHKYGFYTYSFGEKAGIGARIKLVSADQNPRHVQCRWIIRVE